MGTNVVLMSDLSLHKAPSGAGGLTTLSLKSGAGGGVDSSAATPTSARDSAIVAIRHHNAYEGIVFALLASEIVCVAVETRQILYRALIDTNGPLAQV